MTKKELSQLFYLNREIEEDKRKLEELKVAAEGGAAKITGMPHVSGMSRSIESYSILIAEQEELIAAKVKQTIILYNQLNRYIMTIEDSLIRQIISLRYVNGLNWTQVAMSIGGDNTPDGVRMLHNRFLRKK